MTGVQTCALPILVHCPTLHPNSDTWWGCPSLLGLTALTGLLEVEPLHFSCISTSDGTRVERDDASMFTGTSSPPSHNLPATAEPSGEALAPQCLQKRLLATL